MRTRTEDENWGLIAVNYAPEWTSQRKSFARLEMHALTLTIQLRSFTTLKCIRLSFAKVIRVVHVCANTVTSAHSPTMTRRFPSTWLRDLIGMQTFTCSISKPLGVLTRRKTIRGRHAFMLITGKTIGENLTYFLTAQSSVSLGTRLIR